MPGRILHVDDLPTRRMSLRAALAPTYHELTTATSAAEARAALATCQPDLVLVASALEHGSGAALCRVLSRQPGLRHVPIVLLAGAGEPADRREALEAGAADIFSWPWPEPALRARLGALIRVKQNADELLQRAQTARDLGLPGLAEGGATFERPSRVCLIPPDAGSRAGWQAALSGAAGLAPLWREKDEPLPLGAPPDVFVYHGGPAGSSDGLRLTSRLRAAPETRTAGLIMVFPEGDLGRVAEAMELGLSDYLLEPLDPRELRARIQCQVAQKAETDRLRAIVAEGLRLAVTDPLTGLFNRRYAARHLERTAQTGRPFAVLVLDVDRFKAINDRYGHNAGDNVLRGLAERLRSGLRDIDMLARIGGEEFLVILPETRPRGARRVAERLRRLVARTPFTLPDATTQTSVTVSVGVTDGGAGVPSLDGLIACADRALYAAKADGRNRVRHAQTPPAA